MEAKVVAQVDIIIPVQRAYIDRTCIRKTADRIVAYHAAEL